MKRLALLTLLVWFSCGSVYADSASKQTAGPTIAQQYRINKIWAFGDSLTDTGNKGTANENYDPYRATNRCEETHQGKLWIEVFAESLGLPAPTPSGHRKKGRRSGLSGGTNYAVIGARVAQHGLSDVPTQISAYLEKHKPKPTDLFCINGGANDTINREARRSKTKMREEGPFNTGNEAQVADSMLRQVLRLANAGAKRIVVQSVPDLGMTPVANAAGVGSMATAWAAKVNKVLKPGLDKIEADRDVDIIYIDTFRVMHELRDQGKIYGIKTSSQSYSVGHPEKNFWIRTHASDGATPLRGTPYKPSECMFWDPIHPTTAAHRCMGELIFRQFCEQLEEKVSKKRLKRPTSWAAK